MDSRFTTSIYTQVDPQIDRAQLTVWCLNSFTRSFPCGLVGRSKYARFGPFSEAMASLSCRLNVVKFIEVDYIFGRVCDVKIPIQDKRNSAEVHR